MAVALLQMDAAVVEVRAVSGQMHLESMVEMEAPQHLLQ
jgi:hypothetical protein